MKQRRCNWRQTQDAAFIREVLFTSPKPQVIRGRMVPASFNRCTLRKPPAFCDRPVIRKRYPGGNWNECLATHECAHRELDFCPAPAIYVAGEHDAGVSWQMRTRTGKRTQTADVIAAIISAPLELTERKGIVGAAARAYVTGRPEDWRAADALARGDHADRREEVQAKLCRAVSRHINDGRRP